MIKRGSVFALILIMVISLFQPAGSLASIQAASPKLSKTKITLNAGKTKQLKVKNAKGKVKWSTSSKKIATVSKKGVVKGKKEGKATITAKVSGKKLKCVVTVKAAISEKTLSLYVGKSKKLKVTGASKKVKWSTSNKKVATVSKKGVVTAKKEGKATIKAKFGKKKLSCKVTVQKKPTNAAISITFTNGGQKTSTDSATKKSTTYVETTADSLKMTGTVKVTGTTLTKMSWQLVDFSGKAAGSGSLTPGSTFSFTIKPPVGVYTVKVTASDDFGHQGTGSLCVVRTATSNTQSQAVKNGDDSAADNLAANLEKAYNKEETIGGKKQIYTHIIVSRDSALAKLISSGSLKTGDIYRLPQTDALPTGYTGLFVKTINPSDSEFPSSQYVEVIFREPSITELYSESGSIEINAVKTSDPIAFVLAPDGTDLMDPDAVSAVRASSSGTYSSNFFPEGFLKAVDVKASVNNGKVSVGLEMNGLIVYDDDGKASTKDQVTLSGSVGVKDLTVDEKVDWSWGSLNQIYFQESYTKTSSAQLDFYASNVNLKDLVKKANKGFDNSVTTLGKTKLSGVDMSERLLLGFIGINLQGKVPVKDIKGLQAASVEPLIIIALYMDLSGSLSIDSTLKVDCSSYHENVTNIVKNGYKNPKHYTNASYQSSETKGNYTIYKAEHTWKSSSQHTTPEPVITLSTEGKASIKAGLGVMCGIMFEGIIPLDAYAQAYGKGEGSLKGTLEVRPTTTQEEMRLRTDIQAEINVQVVGEAGIEVRVCLTTELPFLGDFDIGTSASLEKKFLDKSLIIPMYNADGYVWGTLSPITYDEQVLTGATLRFYEKDALNVENDDEITKALLSSKKENVKATTNNKGYYQAKGLKHCDYVLLIECPNYEFLIVPKVSFSGDTTTDYHLKHMRDENWLDICQPSEYNNDRHDLFIGDDPNGKMRISGVDYYIGFFLNSGNQGDGDTADAIFDLGGKYQSLDVRIGHVDTSEKLNADLNIYLDGSEEPNQTIKLSCQTSSSRYTINLNGAQTARFSLKKTEWDNWDTSSYGFVEGTWTTSDGTPRGTAVFADPFRDVDMSASWLNVCAPFSYTSMTTATEAKPSSVDGYSTTNGFHLQTQSVFESHGPHAVFNTFGKFSALQVTLCGSLKSMTLYVYLDDDTEARQEITVTQTPQTVTIPLSHANSLRLQLKNVHENWTTFQCVFGDGQWIQ